MHPPTYLIVVIVVIVVIVGNPIHNSNAQKQLDN